MALTSGRSLFPAATAPVLGASAAATRVVTVVLPLVPVTATTGRSSQAADRSNSLRIAVPAPAAARIAR